MGKKIENYCLENVIGEGQFGKVYKATNQKTQQTVAVKVIKIQKFKMSPKLEQFTINQIQTLSKIEDTTNIVKFIQILKTANNYYFVYEYCNGGTLEQLIKQQGHFEQDKAIVYFKDLLKAFKMLIPNNIMHRDIKPSNILINNGVIKLADFGFCKPLKDARDLAQTMLGSPIYMAPEILKGQVYTMKADIWSLGVVLYQMLFGFCPFQERTIARLINLIEQGTVNFPSHIKISQKIEQLLRKMLIKDQFKRMTWQQLFEYNLNPNPPPQRGTNNPFSKKQFSTITQQNNPSSNNSSLKTVQYQSNRIPKLRNKISSTLQTQIQNQQKKTIKILTDKRSNIFKGLKIVQNFLSQSNSKLTVCICCYIIKRVQTISQEIAQMTSKILVEKENSTISQQIKKIINILSQEKIQLDNKIEPFLNQLKSIVQPQDIVYLRYSEQENLAQQKQGLMQLLQIDDYLHGSNQTYSKLTKKQLLQEYQKRVLRNS